MSHVALVLETKLVTHQQCNVMARALEQQLIEVGAEWGRAPLQVVVYDSHTALRPGVQCHPIVLTDDRESLDALAIHYADPYWYAAARVFCAGASGVFDGEDSISEAASHECCEMFVDPLCNLWVDGPELSVGSAYALEVCDPTQTHYDVEIREFFWSREKTRVRLANFVYPSWFDEIAAKRTGEVYDRNSELKRPFTVGPVGYMLVRNRETGAVEPVWASALTRAYGKDGRLMVGKKHPWARTWRRGARF